MEVWKEWRLVLSKLLDFVILSFDDFLKDFNLFVSLLELASQLSD